MNSLESIQLKKCLDILFSIIYISYDALDEMREKQLYTHTFNLPLILHHLCARRV